jgi:hypothetical protein
MMEPKFKVGDKVKVRGTYQHLRLQGLPGVIVICTRGGEGTLRLFGVDFGKVIDGYTHDLVGQLPGATGRWFHLEDLDIFSKKKKKII